MASSNTSAFVGGALAGALVSASRGRGTKIWNVLCIIFLPLWMVAFSVWTGFIHGEAEYAGIGWFSVVAIALTTFATGIAAAKVTFPGLAIRQIAGGWRDQFQEGGLGQKTLILLPAIFIVVSVLFPFIAGVFAAAAVITNGVLVGRAFLRNVAASDAVSARIGAALGGFALGEHLTWGRDGSITLSPIPAGAFNVVSRLEDLHSRIAEFAPEYEIVQMDSTHIVFMPTSEATMIERSAIR